MMSLPRSLSSVWVGTFDCRPLLHPGAGVSGKSTSERERALVGERDSHGHTKGEGHRYSPCHHLYVHSCSVQGRSIGLSGFRGGTMQNEHHVIILTSLKRRRNPSLASHIPTDVQWANGEGNLLSAFRTGSFCHSRDCFKFDSF